MNLQNGNSFTISSPNNSLKNIYIETAQLNGKVWNDSYIEYETIQNGGALEFNMNDTPNKSWASLPKNTPYSLSKSP